jgi:hypothetical protein
VSNSGNPKPTGAVSALPVRSSAAIIKIATHGLSAFNKVTKAA